MSPKLYHALQGPFQPYDYLPGGEIGEEGTRVRAACSTGHVAEEGTRVLVDGQRSRGSSTLHDGSPEQPLEMRENERNQRYANIPSKGGGM
ncbi:hypothetical protein BaRGS_00014619 [Batillaria attramentaria]|uniref:Uncharacterized protein n=1 Tax=Batillaria attramentaria TaxID=370345 RepID=A0ABD0L4D2_9CAEN